MNATATRVAIYCRISFDKTGKEAGVDRQEELCREYAAAKGWVIAEPVLVDNDISATNGKTRPAWERLLAGLEEGTYDGVVSYHTDRLYRSLRDLVRLLDLHKSKAFALGTCVGDLDLSTDMGRLMASILGAVAAGEVERGSQRKTDANADEAKAGKTLSKYRVFGWQENNIHLESIEAHEIKRAVWGLIHKRTTLGKIGARWTMLGLATHPQKNRAGVKASGVWSPAKVRLILQRERNCGRAVYQGKVIDTELENKLGEWDPIVSEADHDLLQGIFASRTVEPG